MASGPGPGPGSYDLLSPTVCSSRIYLAPSIHEDSVVGNLTKNSLSERGPRRLWSNEHRLVVPIKAVGTTNK